MDLVLKTTGALAVFLAWAGLVPFDQLLLMLVVAYFAIGNFVLAGTPVY